MTTELLLDHLTKQLRTPTVAAQYRSFVREAEEHNWSYEVPINIYLISSANSKIIPSGPRT